MRFCEDNGLVPSPLIAAPENRLALARDQRSAYVQANPADDDRHWLRSIFRQYAAPRRNEAAAVPGACFARCVDGDLARPACLRARSQQPVRHLLLRRRHSRERPAEAKADSERLRAEMIGLQEQLDWEAYAAYRLRSDPLTLPGGEPPLALGERAFEIVLARKVAAGEEETSWSARHRSTPTTELPSHWSAEYRALVERRIELIESDLNIGLIEKPEHKRRWASKPWDEQVAAALREWLCIGWSRPGTGPISS